MSSAHETKTWAGLDELGASETATSRGRLRLLAGIVEGGTASGVILTSAFIYHAAVLGLWPAGLAWGVYLAFAVAGGLIHGTLSAIALDKALDRARPRERTLPDVFVAWTASFATILLAAFLLGIIGDLSRVSLTSAYLLGIPILTCVRLLERNVLGNLVVSGRLHFQRISVVGKRRDVIGFLAVEQVTQQGNRVTGALHLEDATDEKGGLDQDRLAKFAAANVQHGASYVVYVGDMSDLDSLRRVASAIKQFSLNLAIAPPTTDRSFKFLDVVDIGPNNVLRLVRKPLSESAVFIKRTMDILMAAFGLVVLSPVLLAIAAAIRLDSSGPIFFLQLRRGFNGETFPMWKFRTMSVMENGPHFRQATRNDDRVTRVGRILRKWSLDELPQLINVLLGNMSMIGPRPHAISHDTELRRRVATYAHRQRIKPGISGWAQVNGFRGATATMEQIEGRIACDLYYIDNWSLLLDVKIVLLTLFSASAHRNVW